MKKSWVKEAAIVAAAIVVLAFCIKTGIENFADRGRTVSVKGLSEREVPANKVVWPIVFKEVGKRSVAFPHQKGFRSSFRSWMMISS